MPSRARPNTLKPAMHAPSTAHRAANDRRLKAALRTPATLTTRTATLSNERAERRSSRLLSGAHVTRGRPGTRQAHAHFACLLDQRIMLLAQLGSDLLRLVGTSLVLVGQKTAERRNPTRCRRSTRPRRSTRCWYGARRRRRVCRRSRTRRSQRPGSQHFDAAKSIVFFDHARLRVRARWDALGAAT